MSDANATFAVVDHATKQAHAVALRWPASTQRQSNAVDYGAFAHFLRQVALQHAPDGLIAAKPEGTLS